MTYIELIVVLSIFAIMSTALLFNYSTFTDQVNLQNLSQDIALQIVTAQKSALSGVLPNVGGAGSALVSTNPDWKPAYGVYFDSTPGTGTTAPNKQIIPFVDTSNNKFYDPTGNPNACNSSNPGQPDTECSDIININSGDYISRICAIASLTSGTQTCINPDPTSVSITFTRPDSSAFFVVNPSGYSSGQPTQAQEVIITIASERDSTLTRNIDVYANGRVEVD